MEEKKRLKLQGPKTLRLQLYKAALAGLSNQNIESISDLEIVMKAMLLKELGLFGLLAIGGFISLKNQPEIKLFGEDFFTATKEEAIIALQFCICMCEDEIAESEKQ